MLSLKKNLAAGALAVAALVGLGGPAGAIPLPVDTGWVEDTQFGGVPFTVNSPWTFTVAHKAVFSITDQFAPGDNYDVFNFGAPLLTTPLGILPTFRTVIGDPFGESGWNSASHQHGQIILGPGVYSLDINGDGAGGLPAALYVRVDNLLPEPITLALFSFGLAGLGIARRRKTS